MCLVNHVTVALDIFYRAHLESVNIVIFVFARSD